MTLARAGVYARSAVHPLRAGILLLAVTLAASPAHAERPRPKPGAAQSAAKAFERGQKLYIQGKYLEAIAAFEEAQKLLPHASTLFNIGRCYESMGKAVQAVEQYRRALAASPESALEGDLKQRIERLRSEPVRVFVSSEPAGARVTVDGARAPEPGVTPVVVKLRPGEHVLILELAGHHLTTQRVEVEMGVEQPVQVKLAALPKPCPPPPPPCPPPPPPCPELRMMELDGLHVHISIFGAFAKTTDRPVAAGPGVSAMVSYRRWIFGGHLMVFPWEGVKISPPPGFPAYNAARPRWLEGELEAGRAFPFRTFFLYATLGVGVSSDTVEFLSDTAETLSRSEQSFAWSVGGGIHAFATRWLSLGVSLRFGLAHGSRINKENPNLQDDASTFPFGMISGVASFHL